MAEGYGFSFGGGGVGRAAHLRADEGRIEALRQSPAARAVPLWRGKPLIAGEGRDRLGWIPLGHPALGEGARAEVFLGFPDGSEAGQGGGAPLFAVDLSGWVPADIDEAGAVAFFDAGEQTHPALPPDHRFADLRGAMTRLSPIDAECAAAARALLGWHETHAFCARCGAASRLVQAGWQRSCPGCGAHHFPRTDPVVIMLVVRGDRLLLGRSHGWPAGMYSCLAGFIEPGETIEDAVRREVAEETGIATGAVRYVASQPWPFPASLMIGCIAEASGDVIVRDPAELEDARWVGRSEVAEVLAGRHAAIRPPRRGAIAEALIRAWVSGRLG